MVTAGTAAQVEVEVAALLFLSPPALIVLHPPVLIPRDRPVPVVIFLQHQPLLPPPPPPLLLVEKAKSLDIDGLHKRFSAKGTT